jgi:hypothetical protein
MCKKQKLIIIPKLFVEELTVADITTDRVITKLYSSKLIMSILEQFTDPLFVERHRPIILSLVDILLFTLNGCIDASLQDIREGLELNIEPRDVRIGKNSKFMESLNKSDDCRAKKELLWINEMKNNKDSWLYKLRNYRNISTHQVPIGWIFTRPIPTMPKLAGNDRFSHLFYRNL